MGTRRNVLPLVCALTTVLWAQAAPAGRAAYANDDEEARAAKRGLWRDASPVVPWNFRASKQHSAICAVVFVAFIADSSAAHCP